MQEALIIAVSHRPVLYDTALKEYKITCLDHWICWNVDVVG